MAGKYIVYADESGSTTLDPAYPVFVLAFCLFEVETYVSQVVPAFQHLKFETFGHDQVVLHEREIRRAIGEFAFLNTESSRNQFLGKLSNVIESADFKIFAAIVDQLPLGGDTYLIALADGVAQIRDYLGKNNIRESDVSIVLEARGKKQDRHVANALVKMGYLGMRTTAPKSAMSTGLQIADLVARPIGINHVRPNSSNRPYEILKSKIHA
ncbi:MAG: hypothetical protein RLZZ590_284 [Actinomycetota bacterium]|jgi:hypothetical protein